MAGNSKCQTTGKTRFSTPQKAKDALLKIKTTTRYYFNGKRRNKGIFKPGLVRYYRCKTCGGYHFTSSETYATLKSFKKKEKEKYKLTEEFIKSQTEGENWKADSLPFIKLNNNEKKDKECSD